jgi:cell wall assembly regulator SMI1
MTRKWRILIIVAAVAVGAMAALILAGPALQRAFFYPKPHGLPPVVSQSVEQLLAHLQSALDTNLPIVAQVLQPGLSEAQISAQEAQGGFRLPGDLRALYRWHNGMATNATLGLLPGQRFLSIEECVGERAMMRQQTGAAPSAQRTAFSVFAGHRRSWVHVLDDGAGDGYFYDPERTEAEGAFFYYMAEGGYYVWFPSFRNFLSGVIECYESHCVRLSADGRSLDSDASGMEKIWQHLAKASESGG